MINVKALTAIAAKQVKAAKLASQIAQKTVELGKLTARHEALVKGIDKELTGLVLDALSKTSNPPEGMNLISDNKQETDQ
ncbi:hypothetical protein [Aeromonas intestinalis]